MSNSQDDIIKYRKGELSPKEMHALEKKALTDPFLADALEGVENTSSENLVQDVEGLNQRILKQRKTVLFTPLRIAAGVILIAASVIVFYQLAPEQKSIALKKDEPKTPAATQPDQKAGPKQEQVKQAEKIETEKRKQEPEAHQALKQNVKPKETKPGGGVAKTDEKPKTETAETKGEAQPNVADVQTLAASEKKAEEVIKAEAKEAAPVSVTIAPTQNPAEDEDAKRERASGRYKKMAAKSEVASGAGLAKGYQASRQITGKVSGEDGLPLPGVNVAVEGTAQGTVTDVNGNFTLQTSGENQRLVFSFIGLQAQEVNITEKDKVDVQLKTDASQLSEVVVTGAGIQSDDSTVPVIRLANPAVGKKAYDKYLDVNVRYPEEALKNNVKGKVVVEISIRPDGSINSYTVVKSLGHGCDEEAIRLIKDGPKWSPTTENGRPVESKARVSVKFNPAKAVR